MAKYSKGQSGNPSGRKLGSKNKRTQLAKLLEPHAENLINKAVELALSGDVQALKLCLERLIPKANSNRLKLDLRLAELTNTDTISTVGKEIISNLISGQLTIDDAQKAFNILHQQCNIIEHVDMAQKLDEISQQLPRKW